MKPPESGQPTGGLTGDTLFPWFQAPDPLADRLGVGGLQLLLGLIGALVTLYAYNRDFLPAAGGRAHLRILEAELADAKARHAQSLASREELLGDPTVTQYRLDAAAAVTADRKATVTELTTQATRERRAVLRLSIPLYLILGPLLAVMLAQSQLQALVIGFGWTAFAQSLGLSREKAEAKTLGEEVVESSQADLDRLGDELASANARIIRLEQERRALAEVIASGQPPAPTRSRSRPKAPK
jgi:hypothetical protein